MKHYYIEFGGGLGDVFNQMYDRGRYNLLRDLGEGERATVGLCTHNPFARELFLFHPNSSRFELVEIPYAMGEAYARARQEAEIPPTNSILEFEPRDSAIVYSCLPADLPALRDLKLIGRPYIVVAAGAGLPDRNIPDGALWTIISLVLEAGYDVVTVGRSYDRHHRKEPVIDACLLNGDGETGIVPMIDKLSVPGTATAVQNASAIVCCHSAINILAWHLNKPQLLLYPEAVYERHIQHKDQWAFGVDRADTVHGLFKDFSPAMVSDFLGRVRAA